ncbi:Calx-beta domain-containing protein [Adhaeribacter soli]|uniref:T9SS type A sorting domain-containing protein n=1 Tax=Adhaeribacter soli TaxID=2607655 RepID=A0A5N1IKV1_9BACT|nr:Calx-beta domain-containing protein [Adhaeribacter soli]KAA9327312.1 T9SS type A sorting domain-containing protein [Adhaeribacter soli]
MKHSYLKKLGLLALVVGGSLVASTEAFAQTRIAQYSFPNSTGSEDSIAVDAQPANATFRHMKRGTGVTPSGSAGTISASAWSTGALDLDDYFTFSVKPAAGYQITIDSIKLDERRSGTGIRDWAVRSSVDNFTTNIATFNVPDDTNTRKNNKITLGSAFDNLTTGVSFRFYGYTAEAAGGTWRLDSVEVYGSIQSAGPAAATLNFASATSSVAENVTGGTLNIPVTITNPSATTATTVTVAVATSGGTATSGTDYILTTGTLTFPAGSSTNQEAVLTITDDILVEGNETINLILTGASTGAAIGANSTHTVTITDNEIAPEISFGTPVTATVAENVTGGTLNIPVTISAASTSPVTVEVALANPSGTATATSDYVFAPQILTFTPAGALTQNAVLTIVNDRLIEANETVILTLRNATGGNIGTASTYTVTIVSEDAIPLYTVAQVTTNHPTTFVADSLNKIVSLRGTLYGVNQRSAGLQLTLIDNTGGIGLYKNAITLPAQGWPTVMPVEGDSVQVWGKVAQFNGLTQIELDSVHTLGTQPLRTPRIVTGPLTEAEESEFIRLANPVTLVTPSQWPTTGTAAVDVDVTDGTNTYRLRIVPSSGLVGTPAPSGPFTVTGIGGQFDNADPRDTGYQLLPRRTSDIQVVLGVSEDLSSAVSIYPNPASGILNLNLSALAGKKATITVVNTLGQVVATVPANATQINVSKFPAGIYTIQVVTPEAKAVKRFVKIN